MCCFRSRLARLLPALCLLLAISGPLAAQSTFGTILGTVRDSAGALIPGAQVTLSNQGTAVQRKMLTDASGSYAFKNVEVGSYSLTFTQTGFESVALPAFSLTARETRRADVALRPGGNAETIVVEDQAIPVINTDVSNLAETKVGEELVNLPVAVYSRSAGSTSPIATLTTEAGVQVDDSGELAVMGTTAALLSVTIDGISSVGVEFSGPVNELFPSFNSIEEIRVSESNNNAEFSGVADITTVSKAGTNRFHGSLFENHENSVINSGDPFSISKPKIIMNDFGATLGGPINLPFLSSPSKPAFFFASYEGLRLPRETPLLLSVPSTAMRSGNLTDYLTQTYCQPTADNSNPCPTGYTVHNPDGSQLGSTSVGAQVTPSTISAQVLATLVPTPNYGADGAFANNYQNNFRTPISANQGDIRFDKTISARQSVFARFSYKNRQVITAPSENCIATYCAEAGSPLLGGFNTPEIDEGLTFAHNFVITPTLLNEFRGGFNAQHTSETQRFSTTDILAKTGLPSLQPDLLYSEAPEIQISGFMSTGAGNPGTQRGQIVELLDNLSWTHGTHAFKFGFDAKRITDHDDNVFGNYRSGWYTFNGDSTVGSAIGDPYTAFLLGYPDHAEFSSTNNPNMNGRGYTYAWFAQDDWKITHSLTLNLGLRYELHPPIRETSGNTATFVPDWTGTISGSQVTGAVVVPDTKALADASSDFINSISPTPVLTAAQAGIPAALRYTSKTDWAPRIGFAWRPFSTDKTVIRGGWGRFFETPLGFALYTGWAVHASYLPTYDQDFATGTTTPLISFTNPFSASTATANFNYAYPIHYKDPSVQQWNLTFEQDFGHGIGLRASYTGSHGSNLDAMVDLNQVPANALGYDQVSAQRPFTSFAVVQSVANANESNYHSATVELSRHAGKALTFDASYSLTRDLSNAGGATPSAFAIAGGSFLTDRFHPGLDYGNVVYDRRHRFLATYLYELPFGHGQRWLNAGSITNLLAGGWQWGGVIVLQSGPFLTPYETTVDPANTNILTTIGQTRPDQDRTVSPYAGHRATGQWLNPAAFPYTNLQTTDANNNTIGIGIGRFGNAPVGGIVGPGTQNFSFSLRKSLLLHGSAKLLLGLEAANALNHRNYEPPNMQVDAAGFGSITALAAAEGAGPRSLQISGRISF